MSKPRKKSGSSARRPSRRSGGTARLRLPGLKPVYRAFCDAGPDFAALPDALEAELWISTHLGLLQERSPHPASLATALLDLVEELERAGRPEACAMLRGLAAVGPAALHEPAVSAADRMSAAAARQGRSWPQPRWLDLLGQAMPGDCWHTVDRYGELEQILCTFVHRDGDRLHGILIERDDSWHGAATDITVVDDTEGCRKHLAKTARKDGSELLPLTHTAAHHAVKDALTAFLAHGLASPARPDVRPDSEFFETTAFAVARSRQLDPGTCEPDRRPLAEIWDETARDALASEYLASPAGAAQATATARVAPKLLIGLSVDVLGRDPRRIGPGTLTRIFTDALPGSLLLPDALLDEASAAISSYYTWVAEQYLPKQDRKEVLRTLRRRIAALPRTLAAFPAHPLRAYIADIDHNGHDGDVLQAVIDRRIFAVPEPGHRWVPRDIDSDEVDDLDPADEEERALIVQEEMRARKVPRRLHPVHEVLANQLWLDNPAQLWPAAQRLRDAGLSREQVLDRLADVLSGHLNQVLRAAPGQAPGLEQYTQALDALGPRA
ncbi:hypothetical protein OG819_44685 [Streptomyces sp. NBC_01549]|uniref:hypothetical protein n=1 Tax=Streptomyces sp. NBC_01549 TaxID=2975874 RepID=UPI00224DA7DD|nr:hypothetical protein [Streptomyces sp. NBC_01549]MCX4596496.1 hypothetical protein [Streptomyces sp. NBC_01549]